MISRSERIYRRTGRLLFVLLGLWVAFIIAVAALSKVISSDLVSALMGFGLPILFLAAAVVGFVRIFAYMRWTGKYPYYFLFRGSRSSRTSENERKSGSLPQGADRPEKRLDEKGESGSM
jgi:hypothetical protein